MRSDPAEPGSLNHGQFYASVAPGPGVSVSSQYGTGRALSCSPGALHHPTCIQDDMGTEYRASTAETLLAQL